LARLPCFPPLPCQSTRRPCANARRVCGTPGVWECAAAGHVCGWTSEHTDGDFAGLPPQEGALCLAYGPQQREDRRGDDLDSPYEEALPLLELGAEQHRFERVEALARHLGTRHWQRRIGFADRAIKTRTRPLAVAVFEAALRPGLHEGFWRRQYEQLKKGKWRPDPRRSEPLIRLCDRVRCAWV
jgi:hypothetical protein